MTLGPCFAAGIADTRERFGVRRELAATASGWLARPGRLERRDEPHAAGMTRVRGTGTASRSNQHQWARRSEPSWQRS
jgi:hypothetical protein